MSWASRARRRFKDRCGRLDRPAVSQSLCIEHLRFPSCIMDGRGTIVAINSVWRDLIGAKFAGRTAGWGDLISASDLATALPHLQRPLGEQNSIDFECRLESEGGPRWHQLSVQSLPDTQDRLCTATDIHSLKCRELALVGQVVSQADMLNVSVDCIKLISLDGDLIHMNKAGCTALGVPENSGFGMPWLTLLPQDVLELGTQALEAVRKGVPARFPGRSILPNGNVQYWDNMLNPVRGSDGEPTAILCVSREVTAEQEALTSLQDNQERLLIATKVGALGIWDYDIQRDELYCDETWYRIVGRDPANPVRSISEFKPFIHPDDVDMATDVMQTAAGLLAEGKDYLREFRIIRPDGDIRWVRSAAYLQGRTEMPSRAVGFVVDITDARRGEEALRDANRTLEHEKRRLARQSMLDPLTRIGNRRLLDTELSRVCRQASGTDARLCIGMIDVDLFKAFNDRYGHVEGDTALRKIASALRSVVRQTDIIARYGGEEFAFVLTEVKDCEIVFERLAAAVAALAIIHLDSPTGFLTVSCGGVIFKSIAGITPVSMFRASDEVLYEAKSSGRNTFILRDAAALNSKGSSRTGLVGQRVA